jgi:hypothetical protein
MTTEIYSDGTALWSCYGCGTKHRSHDSLCNICKASRAQQKQNERLQEELIQQNRQLAHQRQQFELEQQQQFEYQQQEYRRQQLHNQKLAIEAKLSSDDIYSYGLNYLEQNFASDNQEKLSLYIKEDGSLHGEWYPRFELPHLTQALNRGLSDAINAHLGADRDYLLEQAYAAGRQVASGTLKSTFCLRTNVTVAGVDIFTQAFDSKFKSTIDETTGKWDCQWNQPFASADLNERFADGILEVDDEMNTEEAKAQRLEVEVPKIQANRQIAKQQRQQKQQQQKQQQRKQELDEQNRRVFDIATQVLVWVTPLILWFLAWEFTSGLTTFFTMAFVVPAIFKLMWIAKYD